jgi:hypothetical protein
LECGNELRCFERASEALWLAAERRSVGQREMNATDLLTTLAQLGVALAGFSGIVVVLGARASDRGPLGERQLLSVLLATSGAVILWSLLPLLLFVSQLPDRRVWLLSSGSWVIGQVGVLTLRVRQVAQDRSALSQERGFVTFGFFGGVTALAVQLVNLLWLGVAWPHLAAVTWHLALSFLVFVRLLQPPTR